MPNIWAHIQFGREIAEGLGFASRLSDPKWRTAFQFGCQGPDFLFYHRFLPWQKSTAANRLGTLLHNEECGPFLLDLFALTRGREAASEAWAFAAGFLLHHILDRHLHPFVFSLSGFRKWNHQRFETAMDYEVMRRRAGLDTSAVPVAPEIDTGGRLPGLGAEAFRGLVVRHYPGIAPDVSPAMLDEAVRDMIAAQKLFFDPRGWKAKLLFGQIEPFSPPRRPPAYDVLNLSGRDWVDPVERTVRRRENALELWDRALADGFATVSAGIAWLEASETEAASRRTAFAERLGNVSYETGRACGEGWITYAEPIL